MHTAPLCRSRELARLPFGIHPEVGEDRDRRGRHRPGAGREGVGVLYRLSANELAAIDRKEGYGWAYTRVVLPVHLQAGGSECIAVTYTVLSKAPAWSRPPARISTR